MNDLEVAIAAATAGAAVVREGYAGPLTRHAKSGRDFTTDVDLGAERAILEVLRSSRPDDAILGEESGSSGRTGARRRWLVDPLCGTLNFAAQTPLVAVNVALLHEGQHLASVCVDPIADEVFWSAGAATGVRRARRDEPLLPSPTSGLVDVNCDGSLDQPFVGPQLVGDPDLRRAFGPRVMSTTLALAWVAAGRRAAYVTDGDVSDSVHFAAGIGLCLDAGCVVTDLGGGLVGSGRGLIAAADHATHALLVAVVAPHLW